MAYSYPYYPQQPYPYQDQLSQLRNPMQAQAPYQRTDPNGILWVQGEAGAKSWFVNPGSTVLLMDSETMRFYLKSSDVNGIPAMRTFEYTEVGGNVPAAPAAASAPGNFVTVDAFEEFKDSVSRKLEELAQPVEVSVSRKRNKEE